jgi:hypothetical protein
MKDHGRNDAIEVMFDGEAKEADDGVGAAIDCAVPPPEVRESDLHQINLLRDTSPSGEPAQISQAKRTRGWKTFANLFLGEELLPPKILGNLAARGPGRDDAIGQDAQLRQRDHRNGHDGLSTPGQQPIEE